MSQIEEELHVDTPPEVEQKPKKKAKPATSTDTERARAAVRAKLAAK
jgi:hypothetical protein